MVRLDRPPCLRCVAVNERGSFRAGESRERLSPLETSKLPAPCSTYGDDHRRQNCLFQDGITARASEPKVHMACRTWPYYFWFVCTTPLPFYRLEADRSAHVGEASALDKYSLSTLASPGHCPLPINIPLRRDDPALGVGSPGERANSASKMDPSTMAGERRHIT